MLMNSSSDKKPAILSGPACFPQGPPEWPFPNEEVNQILQQAQQSGVWGKYHGPYLEQLQQELANIHQTEQTILCSSGTVAVELALRGLGIEKGDEVILAAYDFEGNFKNILAIGATPVLIDVNENNCNLDLNQLEQAITKDTKCILVSHLHGGLVPMQALNDLSEKRGIPIIEDACQVPGIKIEGRMAGTWGEIGILSFGGSKLLTAGRGGALLTKSPQIAQRIKLYSYRGNEAYPLTELQAGLLIPQLKRLQADHQKRHLNVSCLLRHLGENSGLTSLRNTDQINETSPFTGYYKLGFKFNKDRFSGLSRELFCKSMQAEGIALYPGFRALHKIHSRRRFKQTNQLPIASMCDHSLVVLHHPILLTDEKIMMTIAQSVSQIQNHANEIIHAYT